MTDRLILRRLLNATEKTDTLYQ